MKCNKEIIIKKADKSNTIVILEKDKYIAEGLRQLQSIHYTETNSPDLAAINETVQNKLKEMHRKGTLDKVSLNYLSVNEKSLRIGYLYLLPKIHKFDKDILDKITNGDIQNIPNPTGRPIISQIETVCEKIGRFCDIFLKPIVENQNTYICDSSDFSSVP